MEVGASGKGVGAKGGQMPRRRADPPSIVSPKRSRAVSGPGRSSGEIETGWRRVPGEAEEASSEEVEDSGEMELGVGREPGRHRGPRRRIREQSGRNDYSGDFIGGGPLEAGSSGEKAAAAMAAAAAEAMPVTMRQRDKKRDTLNRLFSVQETERRACRGEPRRSSPPQPIDLKSTRHEQCVKWRGESRGYLGASGRRQSGSGAPGRVTTKSNLSAESGGECDHGPCSQRRAKARAGAAPKLTATGETKECERTQPREEAAWRVDKREPVRSGERGGERRRPSSLTGPAVLRQQSRSSSDSDRVSRKGGKRRHRVESNLGRRTRGARAEGR
ncbi:hypothetical protein Q5P01_000129 [Channa striata]|uniref:Uncharacterized protein n=1 Tax=Channa striata TaxID=64152 RepID=A0AA88IK17_CHASR|nr:hypothetical protein Q5P01_000129 [Channa striata]